MECHLCKIDNKQQKKKLLSRLHGHKAILEKKFGWQIFITKNQLVEQEIHDCIYNYQKIRGK